MWNIKFIQVQHIVLVTYMKVHIVLDRNLCVEYLVHKVQHIVFDRNLHITLLHISMYEIKINEDYITKLERY